MITERINIDVRPGGVPVVIHVTQYEAGLREFVFTPYTSDGELTVVAGSATLEGTKPDGYAFQQACEMVDGVVTYTLQEQLCAVEGRVWSRLVIRDTDGGMIGYTAIVWVVGRAGVADDAVMSDSDISALRQFLDEFGTIDAYRGALNGALAAVGGPLVAATASAMTDTTKVYVYTGSESGYTEGHWYYWNGSAWTDGGVYQSTGINTDKTLTVEDMAADAKATGDAVTELENELNILNIDANLLFPIYNSFERITSALDGSWITSTTRIACRTILYTDRQIFLTPNTGYNWAWNTFDAQGNYIRTSGWNSGTFAIPANTYFCVLLRKSDNSDILPSESLNLYMSIPKDGIRELRQTALVYGTSGTMAEPTITKSGTTLTVTIPTRMFILGYDFSVYLKDFSEVQTISVPHNYVLYYDFSDGTIKTTSYTNLSKVYTDIVILMYNNNGRPVGQFSKYFDRVTGTDIKLLRAVAVYADTNGENAIGVSNASATSETVTAIIPVRCFVFGYTNSIYTVDKEAITRLDVPHNYVLYLDLSDNSYNVKSYTNYFNVTNDKVLLFYNNHGKAMGQWGKYQNELCSSDNFKTTIFCSRQGDIDGCPENSLIGLKRAKTFGYNRVRVSVSFTADNVPVCFHDEYLGTRSIVYDDNGDLVTNISKKINEYTYNELLTYDFGLYKGELYRGTRIATLEDVVLQCRNLGCELDIETKFGWDSNNISIAYNMVALNGMISHTMFVSDNITNLQAIIATNEYASVAYASTVSESRINRASELRTGKNNVWFALLDTDYNNLTDELRLLAIGNGIRFKYCSVYSTSSLPAAVRKCDMVEIAYMKYPAFYVMKGV